MKQLKPEILSLLPALQALLKERHVSRAAERVDTSQPQMSRILIKLRKHFDDHLLVRSGSQYQLTPKAQQLIVDLDNLLPQVAKLWEPTEFSPADSHQTLTIAGTDMDVLLISDKIKQIQQQAPNLRVAISNSTPYVLDRLLEGQFDIALIATDDDRAGLYRKLWLQDEYVIVLDKQHALANKKLTLAHYLKARHCAFGFKSNRQGYIDGALERMGKSRKLVLKVPNSTQLPALFLGTDLLCSMPRGMAEFLAKLYPIKLRPLPFETPKLKIYMYWHQRQHQSPLHSWVRGILLPKSSNS